MIDDPTIIKASTELATILAKNTTQKVIDKIRVSKEAKDDKKTINTLEDIINDLISEKNKLIQIAQTYDEQLVAQKISEEEVNYITDNILPLLEKLLENSENYGEDKRKLEMLKPILSKETINILQLLGFNFKRAIGEPLTELINGLIASNTPPSQEKKQQLEALIIERDIEHYKFWQDVEAVQKYKELSGKHS
ncbi:hypothetical protein COO16_04080 [Bacillus pseudomycoides]|uniref:hypothetical protein n=1 Tax=Bacillus pseudomycoides TaxID=64104 RepID=UPI000BEE6116|nr:hypothetical protein [Bacillus pseudomycoides]PDY14148.1 hypothetical protein COO16_04080 [Bacillus pseudomycoides]